MRTSKFSVKGMHCPSCEMLIADSLEDLEGVELVKASHKDNEVVVTYDETKVDKDKIKKIIVEEGYIVE
jgi:copper chaperone CopZ